MVLNIISTHFDTNVIGSESGTVRLVIVEMQTTKQFLKVYGKLLECHVNNVRSW